VGALEEKKTCYTSATISSPLPAADALINGLQVLRVFLKCSIESMSARELVQFLQSDARQGLWCA